jgi:PAS domain S-box-containing protein
LWPGAARSGYGGLEQYPDHRYYWIPLGTLMEVRRAHDREGREGPNGLRILFAAAAGLLLASVGITYLVGLNALKSNGRLSHQQAVMQQLQEVVLTITVAETGQQGFLLTGEPQYLQDYQTAQTRIRSELDALRQLAKSGDLPTATVGRITEATDEKLGELAETIELKEQRGSEAALNLVRSGKGKGLMDEIRAQVSLVQTDEAAEYARASDSAQRTAFARTFTYLLTLLLNLGFLANAYFRVSAEIRRRKAATVEVELRKELLATTLASIGDAVIVTDKDGRVTFLNTEAERLTGWRQQEALGSPLTQVFQITNELTRQRVENPVEKVLRLGTVLGLANHTVLIAKDGKEVPIDDSGAPVRRPSGPIEGVVLVFRDVGAQRRAEEAAQRLVAIVTSSDDAILSKTIDGTIQSWNDGAVRMFGYTAQETIGKSILILVPPELASEEQQVLERVGRGERTEHYDTLRLAKNGERLEVSLSVSPIRDKHGRILGASTIMHDIRVRKQTEQMLARHREELERQVNERTASLLETTEQLNSFVYTVAHDLRAPLRAQHGFAAALLEDFGHVLGEAGREYVQRIFSAAKRLEALVNDLLAYASVSREKVPLGTVDLQKIAGQARRDLSEVLSSPGVTLDTSGVQGKVRAHESSLQLVVNNLVSNALKFTRPGEPAHARLWTERQGDSVRLWVEDRGIGIAPRYHSKLFGVFQRLHSAEQYPGTGIGLALVKKGVERMGGDVGLESEAGKGSRFWVELKAAA